MVKKSLPKLVTFDGEARSGKGTIAHYVKRALQAQGLKVMLIDRGQAFRGLVVSAMKNKVDVNDPAALDIFLSDSEALDSTVQLLKTIYHMSHEERDALLYTNLIGESSAKIGARPLSQTFVHDLTIKWLQDAKADSFDVVLMDGRALEAIAIEAEAKGIIDFPVGLYFVCDSVVGARRTLGYAGKSYDELAGAERTEVDEFVAQIDTRNHADKTRPVERVSSPKDAIRVTLPGDMPQCDSKNGRCMFVIDTSAEMTKDQMCEPVTALLVTTLGIIDKS